MYSREQLIAAIPAHTLEALTDYVSHGRQVSGFLFAVLSGDLFKAVTLADGSNKRAITEIALYITYYLPAKCYGSEKRVEAWELAGGLEGLLKATA